MSTRQQALVAGSRSRWVVWGGRLVVAVLMAAVVTFSILAAGTRLLPYRAYVVLSGSMEPTLPVGSLIVMRPVSAADLRPGDIITVQRPGPRAELVTHRIVATEEGVDGLTFVTKGDANSEPDSWRVPAAGAGWRYAFAIPYLGFVLNALHLPVVRSLLLLLPAGAGALLMLRSIWQPKPGRNAA